MNVAELIEGLRKHVVYFRAMATFPVDVFSSQPVQIENNIFWLVPEAKLTAAAAAAAAAEMTCPVSAERRHPGR